ncbi:MAG: hypothetical protein GWP10_21665 [Nitrospiraceae bacterium]|nr:hypothetical protein [Nitrospiraceae bacterium]
MAAGPGWQDVPGDLKNAAGVESNGGYVYATGLARALNIRPDKAHEVARKKSLLHALQLLHVACSCHDIVKGLRPEEQRKFFLLFALDFPPLYAKGLVVIRQWERGAEHLSTVALPQSALKDVPCEFPDLLTAISHYAGLENVTEEGLAFCLRHVPRYSHMAQVVQRRVGRFYLEQGMKTMALCFLKDREGPVSPLEVLGIQNRLARATQLNSLAERAARKGKWDVALDLTSRSLAPLMAGPILSWQTIFSRYKRGHPLPYVPQKRPSGMALFSRRPWR